MKRNNSFDIAFFSFNSQKDAGNFLEKEGYASPFDLKELDFPQAAVQFEVPPDIPFDAISKRPEWANEIKGFTRKSASGRLFCCGVGNSSTIKRLARGMEEEPRLRVMGERMSSGWENRKKCFFSVTYPGGSLELGKRTLLMGIINVTPDSFYDGGKYSDPLKAVERAMLMEDKGADIIDIGGESSRPGAEPKTPGEELGRILPVVRILVRKLSVPISVDTYHAETMRVVLDEGVQIINDISGLGHASEEKAECIVKSGAAVILMHMRGVPANMKRKSRYESLFNEIQHEMGKSISKALDYGIAADKIIIDPGIGFAKNPAQNFRIMRRLETFRSMGFPLLLGISRKSFIWKTLKRQPSESVFGTAGASAAAVQKGVDILRVHDAGEMKEVVMICDRIYRTG